MREAVWRFGIRGETGVVLINGGGLFVVYLLEAVWVIWDPGRDWRSADKWRRHVCGLPARGDLGDLGSGERLA